MRVRDLSEWQLLLSDFAADSDPMAEKLQKLVQTWGSLAEAQLKHVGPAEALRRTLDLAEERTERLPIQFVGMAVLILYIHWDWGGEPDQLYNELTSIEQRLFQDVGASKILELASQAEEAGNGS